MKDISIILNCYKRPHVLEQQIKALKSQSIQAKKILIWQNKGDQKDFEPLDHLIQKDCVTAISNYNFGVWSRFAYALNTTTDFICIFDDDTIPGKLWLENCINAYEKQRGLYGTIGVIFNDLSYFNYERFGWANPNEDIIKVDIVGHSWFFDREMLGAFWREAPVPIHSISGEDVHFSYSIQKYMNLNTYVPPHPKNNKDLWGSQPETAVKYGMGPEAASCFHSTGHFGANLVHYHKKGFKYLMNL